MANLVFAMLPSTSPPGYGTPRCPKVFAIPWARIEIILYLVFQKPL